MLCQLSRVEFQKLYDRMDVKLEEVGESFYNPMLKPMIEELKEKKLAVEDQGAICIFVGKKKAPPLIIQKSDGGFGYASTDMAAIRYRANELKCDRIVYVTDVGQEFHFKQVFEAAEKCEFVDKTKTKLDHMMFGMVLQKNAEGKLEKIKTRAGKSVKLIELLDEAKERQLQKFKERMGQADAQAEEPSEDQIQSGEASQPQVKVQIEGEEELEKAAEILGISSVKYFDLKQNRI